MSVRKLARTLYLVNMLQLVLGMGILIGLWSDLLTYSEEIQDASILLVLFGSLLSMGGLFSLVRYQRKNFDESLKNLENLNTRLRAQRHDYLNQIQIVHGLLELGEYENAREYLRPVFRDIMKVNRALKTAQPAVNALLQAKLEEAERQGIDFYLEIGSQLKNLPMEPWELCKVLANLIDNAVTAVAGEEGEKWIRLEIGESREEYVCCVRNNGPEIPPQQRKQIFHMGYTTKNGEGHGMGLFIVSSIVREAGGGISVESRPGETVFDIVFPKKKPPAVSSEGKRDRLMRKLYK